MLYGNSNLTIILVTGRRVIRNDFARDSNRPVFQLEFATDPESSICDAIRQVVSGQRRCASKALILSSEVWSQIILLPRKSVQGIEPSELTEALKFEAETLSGLEIDDLSLASLPLDVENEFQQYWVSTIRTSELNEVHQLLESCGARSISLAHPAGLTRNKPNRNCLEGWSAQSFLFSAHHTGPTKIVQSAATLADDVAKHWSELSPDDIDVLNGPNTSIGSTDTRIAVTDLSNPEEIENWLASIAKSSREVDAPIVPTLQIGKKVSSTSPRSILAVGLLALTIGLCVLHYKYIDGRNAYLEKEVEAIKQPGQLKKNLDSQLVSLLETRTKLESEVTKIGENLKCVQFFVDQQRDRFTKLLGLLVELRQDDFVIEKIGHSEEGVVISGVSLNGEAAQAFAKQLREISNEMGWSVNPANQEGQQKLTSGGPWNFDIVLTDIGPFNESRTRELLRQGGLQSN